MTGASVSPVGRCDICGKRLYDGDAYISIIQNAIMVTEVCSDCAKITYRGKRASIVDFVNSCSPVYTKTDKRNKGRKVN